MRVAVTGTPGTGKTTATNRLESRLSESTADPFADLEVIHLNGVLEREGFYTEVDAERDSKVADLDALAEWLDGRDDVVIESHLAHHFSADRVVVLRCRPAELERRLLERGEPDGKARENAERTESSRALARKARENAESEALDVILSEAVEEHGLESVYEIDTTERDPDAVVDELEAVVAGERDPSAGEVDFVGYLV
ncbi:adenylate kinase family protein [Natrialbaceae archaeon GCM10025810]|uniref:adenylate kinase family protein n=1 Tax=Halovalidus salilacus TaxID=3075124 RepID=UPI00361FA870